jgi:hypothetical protein
LIVKYRALDQLPLFPLLSTALTRQRYFCFAREDVGRQEVDVVAGFDE